MAEEIEIRNFDHKTVIECESEVDAGHHAVVHLEHLFHLMHLAIPLASFTLEADDGGYVYEFTARDGRIWRQRLQPDDAPEGWGMNFCVTDYWKLSEFRHHRPIRDHVIEIISLWGVSKISVAFEEN